MIIYNVTVNVEKDIHDEWLQWMKEIHIPEVMATGFFNDNRMLKILEVNDEGTSYAIQYTCDHLDKYEKYREEFAPALQKKTVEKFGEKFVAFRTLLEII